MLLLPATPCNSCSFAMNSFDAGLTVYHKRTSIPSSIGTMLPCFETKSHHAILTFLPPWSFIPQANELSLSQSITYRTATWTPPDKHEEDYPHVHETCRNPNQPAGNSSSFVLLRERKKKPPSKNWSQLVLHGPIGPTPQSDRVTMCLGASCLEGSCLETFYRCHHPV
jgi:hypothetical protein